MTVVVVVAAAVTVVVVESISKDAKREFVFVKPQNVPKIEKKPFGATRLLLKIFTFSFRLFQLKEM